MPACAELEALGPAAPTALPACPRARPLQARYFSLSLYNSDFNIYTYTSAAGANVTSGLTDFQVPADAGSTNPFQTAPGRRRGAPAPAGTYTVSIV